MPAVARIGDFTSHGGVLAAPMAKSVLTGDRPAAHVGTLHVCPRPDHNVRPIVKGSRSVFVEDKPMATVGSATACGAVVVTGASDTEAG